MDKQVQALRDLVVAHQNFLKASREFREASGLIELDAVQIEVLTQFCAGAEADKVDADQFETLFKVMQ